MTVLEQPLGEFPGLPPMDRADIVRGRRAGDLLRRAGTQPTAEEAVLLIAREQPAGNEWMAAFELARRLDALTQEVARG